MKKKLLNSMRVLLVAALLGGASSAWADDVYEPVYTRAAVSAWTEDDLTEWGGDTNLTIDENYGLYFNTTKPSAAYSATKSFSIAKNAKVKYEVTWYTGNSTGRTSNYEYIKFGDKVIIGYNSNYHFYLSLTGACDMTVDLTDQLKTPGSSNITIIFNTATKTVENFTFRGKDITSNVSGALEGAFNSVTFGLQRGGGTSNWAYPNGLQTITVSQAEQTVTIANYTINYKLGDDVVKTVSSSSSVDALITAETAIDGEGDFADKHYLITAEEAPSMTLVDGTNVLNVPVRAPYTATLTIKTTIGDEEQTPVVKTLTETDTKVCSWSYAYPLYVKGGDVYYKADNSETFGEGGTFTDGQTITKSVSYSTVDNDVVYFYDQATEGTTYTYTNGANSNVSAQNARGGSTLRGIGLIELNAGNYEFITYFTARNGRGLGIRNNDDATDPIVILTTDKNDAATQGLRSANFTLNATTSLVINGANSSDSKTNQSEDFDYIIIKKLPTSIEVNMSDAGWATLYTPYALDFTTQPGITAYTAAVADGKVTLTKVDNVPANTGVVLKGDGPSFYQINVAASSETAKGDLLGSATDATAFDAYADNTLYMLKKVGEKAQFVPVTGGEIAAGKAYLKVANATTARNLDVTFADEATGIESVKSEEIKVKSEVYNLKGQRVSEPTKGLYIVNGKKIAIK